MTTYLKNMGGYKPSQLKNKSFEEVQRLFNKEMVRVNTFVAMDTEAVESSAKKDESSSKKVEITQESSSGKRAGDHLEQEKEKKQKTDDDQEEEEEMKVHIEIVIDEEIAIDDIPLSTKPTPVVNFQIHKVGRQGYYEIIRADGSSKTYLVFSGLLKDFDREDLENLWNAVKAKHGYKVLKEAYERVLWGDLKTMFEQHIEDGVWKDIRGHKVLLWNIYDSCGVHFVKFQNMHLYMLVEKKYPLTPATITDMLNRKLQADHWNEMVYQLLKLLTKQLKNPGSV
ncbi:hypothetical protein Tco_0855200 [Tanacetum coccineum]